MSKKKNEGAIQLRVETEHIHLSYSPGLLLQPIGFFPAFFL
jgi:hypothetical protein